jgi:hypothetical protein
MEVSLYMVANPLPNEQIDVKKSSKATKHIVWDMKY